MRLDYGVWGPHSNMAVDMRGILRRRAREGDGGGALSSNDRVLQLKYSRYVSSAGFFRGHFAVHGDTTSRSVVPSFVGQVTKGGFSSAKMNHV